MTRQEKISAALFVFGMSVLAVALGAVCVKAMFLVFGWAFPVQ